MLHIHIGFPKTGSTTIQAFAAENSEDLSTVKVIYPQIGRQGRAHFNYVHQLREPSMYVAELGGVDELRELMLSAPEKNYFLSCESFHVLEAKAVSEFKSCLPEVNVQIIAYIRPLASLIVSIYAQNAKMGYATEDFDRFFTRRASGNAAQLADQVLNQIKNWASAFGWENLRVRALTPSNLAGGDLLTDLLESLGLRWSDLPSVSGDSLKSRNISPGWKAIELMRLLHARAGRLPAREDAQVYRAVRREAWTVHRLAEQVSEELGFNADPGVYLTTEQAEICDRAYRSLVRELNSHLSGPPIPEPSGALREGRRFLPDADEVPIRERADFFERMSFKLAAELRAAGEELGGSGARRIPADRAAQREERKAQRKAARTTEAADNALRHGDNPTPGEAPVGHGLAAG